MKVNGGNFARLHGICFMFQKSSSWLVWGRQLRKIWMEPINQQGGVYRPLGKGKSWSGHTGCGKWEWGKRGKKGWFFRCMKLNFGLVCFKEEKRAKKSFLRLILKSLKRKNMFSHSYLVLTTLDVWVNSLTSPTFNVSLSFRVYRLHQVNKNTDHSG